MSNTEAPELAALLARYQQAWTDGDIEGILSMTPPDGVYEASFGPHPWGQRFVGHDEIRAALLDMGLDQPGTLAPRVRRDACRRRLRLRPVDQRPGRPYGTRDHHAWRGLLPVP